MTSQPTTGPVPRLQADAAPRARREPDAHRGLPITLGGSVAIVLLVLAVVALLVTVRSDSMRAAGNALVVAAAFAIVVVAILVASIPRVLRDRALRRRFPDAVVATVGRGVRVRTRSLVVDDDRVTVWATTAEPESTWDLDTVTRVVAVRSRRRIQRTADLVLVVDGRDEVFRPFRSATSFAERMPRAGVDDLARAVRGD